MKTAKFIAAATGVVSTILACGPLEPTLTKRRDAANPTEDAVAPPVSVPTDLGTFDLTSGTGPTGMPLADAILTKIDEESMTLATPDGKTWVAGADAAWRQVALPKVKLNDADRLLSAADGTFWVVSSSSVARAGAETATDEMSTLGYRVPGLRVDAKLDLSAWSVKAFTADRLALVNGRDLVVATVKDAKLELSRLSMPPAFASLSEQEIGGVMVGFAKGRALLWASFGVEMRIFLPAEADLPARWESAKAVWQLDAATTQPAKLALMIDAGADGTYKVGGSVHAVVGDKFFSTTKAAATTGGDEAPIRSFVKDVRALADRHCVQCHDWAKSESEWRARKDDVSRRLDPARKTEAMSMPLIGSVPAQNMTDAERVTIRQWLAQP